MVVMVVVFLADHHSSQESWPEECLSYEKLAAAWTRVRIIMHRIFQIPRLLALLHQFPMPPEFLAELLHCLEVQRLLYLTLRNYEVIYALLYPQRRLQGRHQQSQSQHFQLGRSHHCLHQHQGSRQEV